MAHIPDVLIYSRLLYEGLLKQLGLVVNGGSYHWEYNRRLYRDNGTEHGNRYSGFKAYGEYYGAVASLAGAFLVLTSNWEADCNSVPNTRMSVGSYKIFAKDCSKQT